VTIVTNFDPVAYLKQRGFSAHQEVSPTSGYSGTFTPEVVFGHWTASAPGSDNSSLVVRQHHYASCTNRSGHTAFGGYKVRQGHGGEGRTQPMDECRRGQMTASRWKSWMDSKQADNTASQPNLYGMSFCLDCTVDESVSRKAVDAWLAVGAMWLVKSNLNIGYAMCHSVSTDRKIDINYLIVDSVRWGPTEILGRLEYWIGQFRGSPVPPSQGSVKMYAVANHPTSSGYAIVKPDGGVFNFQSPFYGSAAGHIMAGETATDLCWTSDGKGYWVISSAGRVYTFGNAPYKGGCMDPGVLPPNSKLAGAATKIEGSKTNQGYRISCDDGGLFCFGDAPYLGHI
jgi:hypothetical protein